MDSKIPLQFGPFSSFVHPAFWSGLSKMKLEVMGLDEKPIAVLGTYANNDQKGLPASLGVDWNAFNDTVDLHANVFLAHGKVLNTNTLDAFKTCDKKKVLEMEGHDLWEMFQDGRALQSPSNLNRFVILMHADLKQYIYYYWFAFPAFTLPDEIYLKNEIKMLDAVCSQEICDAILASYTKWQEENLEISGFFVLFLDKSQKEQPAKICSLQQGIDEPQGILCFADSWTGSENPGWPLRNLLALVYFRNPDRLNNRKILSLRQNMKNGSRSIGESLTFTIVATDLKKCSSMPNIVGWEKNEKGQFGPRFVNMKASMDPKSLAESSMNLNLKLMKWRLVPELDLDSIANKKCLILGSGTLGCNVARCLLAWGLQNITFVDRSKVSYSNPVRQSLFTLEDCLNGGSHKAEAAARMLSKIHPTVNVKSVDLSVPMPGHAMSGSLIEEVSQDFQKLDELVQTHDILFLLMDTRESRWLPTVMGAHYNKLVINAALGFDSFLVMRHGVRTESTDYSAGGNLASGSISGNQLGCYFCNDIVAPGNSTRDRTLDQQCTVSRPGVSYIAGSLAVELMASVLQHPCGPLAPATIGTKNGNNEPVETEEGLLGCVPHSIRGSINSFQQFTPATALFSQCTGCSPMVLKAFAKDKFYFLQKVCNESNYLEDLTGLTKLMSEMNFDDVLEFTDESSIDPM